MIQNSAFNMLRNVVTIPTAPFQEELVADFIKNWAISEEFDCSIDDSGNLFVTFANGGKEQWILEAHMDHPGFQAVSQEGNIVSAWFRGGVKEEYFIGQDVVFFSQDEEITGTIESIVKDEDTKWFRCEINIGEGSNVRAGSAGMWHIPDFDQRGDIIASRVCDDLAGVAAIMTVLENLKENNVCCHCTALFTRAEEVGFVGAIGACRGGHIPQSAHIIAVETSKAQPGAGLGDGVVIRVGDKTSTFSPLLTGYVDNIAKGLKKEDEDFAYVRMLMPGGTCESSVYCTCGYSATGLCLALGNYHNMGSDGRPAPEEISFFDYENLVKLMEAVVSFDGSPQGAADAWMDKNNERYDRLKQYL